MVDICMNSRADLIERLKGALNGNSKFGGDWGVLVPVEDLQQAITALSPVIPDEVEESLTYLRDLTGDNLTKAADLLESLCRENAQLIATLDAYIENNNNLQSRIEELEAPVMPDEVAKHIKDIQTNSHIDCVCYDNGTVEVLERLQREKEDQRLAANHWVDKYDTAQQRIKELTKPVMPADIHAAIDSLNNMDAYTLADAKDIADLLGRLARDCKEYDEREKLDAEVIKALQQRIEKLEANGKLQSDNVNFMCEQQDFIDLMNDNDSLTFQRDQLAEALREIKDFFSTEGAIAGETLERIMGESNEDD